MQKTKKVILFDFDDSFTYNIVSHLYRLQIPIQVMPHREIINTMNSIKEDTEYFLIYGPGPGHPNDYAEYHPWIKLALGKKNVLHWGICLGHQLLMQIWGHKIIDAKTPMHGQSFPLVIPAWRESFASHLWGKIISVQRYNSLAVKTQTISNAIKMVHNNGECMLASFPRGLSYQFHPESIGTSQAMQFFFWPFHWYYGKNFLS